MTLAQLITAVLGLSIAAIVFAIGLEADHGTVRALLRRPGLLARSLGAMFVVAPLLAVAMVLVFKLRPPVEAALVLMALSPVPPVLPRKATKAGGSADYAVALLAIAALVAIAFVPAALEVLARVFDRPLRLPATSLARVVGTSVLVPLLAGMVVRRLAPQAAVRLAGPVATGAAVTLVLALVPVLVKAWPAIGALVGDFTLVAIVVAVASGLAAGHLLGGPVPGDRTVLALSTATRHPGVAIAIAHASFPDRPEVPAAILLYLLVAVVVSVPYVKWRARAPAQASA
jgi:BASS family bile acid:Na+ symporter